MQTPTAESEPRRSRRWHWSAGQALAAALLAVGCSAPDPGQSPSEQAGAADPRTVIALAPSVVELLYELELGERLVGVGDFCEYPPEVASKRKLGGLFDPHLEQITRLRPDLAILLPSEERLRTHLERLGIEVLTVPSESLDDIEIAALAIGRRFGIEERGAAFVERWRGELTARPLAGEPRVLLALSRQPGVLAETLSAGSDTFYNELLERMGAVNVFGDAASRYPQVSLEEAIERRPEAILDLRAGETDERLDERLRADWEVLEGVPALENDCHRVLTGDYVLLPGPRLPRLYREMRAALESCGF